MSLILPGGPCFQYCVDNLSGVTPSSSQPGTAFTYGGANSDGAAVAVVSSPLAYDCHYLVVGIGMAAQTSGENNSALMDVLIDRAGGTSWGSFIDNLLYGTGTVLAAGSGMSQWFHFPVYIPAGATLGVRGRKNGATANAARVVMYLYGQPKRPEMWWCGANVESLGIVEASSKGTAFTPGNTGAWSTPTSIGTSTRRYGAIQFAASIDSAAATSMGYHFQMATASAQWPGTPTQHRMYNTSEVGSSSGYSSPIFCDIPASTQLYLRGTATGTAQAHTGAIYGVY